MNKDYLFLENLYQLLEQGYGVEEALMLCKEITHHHAIDHILIQLREGYSLDKVILEQELPTQFLEFFEFFSLRLTISDAIRNALNICKHLDEAKKKLKNQLTYPAILITFLVMFSLFATFVLFPQVNNLFASFSIETSILFKIVFMLMRLIPIVFILLIIGIFISSFIFYKALRSKNYMTIEKYMGLPLLKKPIQKYFTLKFSLYFNELLKDHLDSNSIITMLNDSMNRSDIKIVIFEIYTRIQLGEAFEQIIDEFEYFDPLFVLMYKMYLQSPDEIGDMHTYIDIVYESIDALIAKFIKYLIPSIYSFVAFFVIVIYIAIILPMMNVIGDI